MQFHNHAVLLTYETRSDSDTATQILFTALDPKDCLHD